LFETLNGGLVSGICTLLPTLTGHLLNKKCLYCILWSEYTMHFTSTWVAAGMMGVLTPEVDLRKRPIVSKINSACPSSFHPKLQKAIQYCSFRSVIPTEAEIPCTMGSPSHKTAEWHFEETTFGPEIRHHANVVSCSIKKRCQVGWRSFAMNDVKVYHHLAWYSGLPLSGIQSQRFACASYGKSITCAGQVTVRLPLLHKFWHNNGFQLFYRWNKLGCFYSISK
jgi:hypothetical protein